MSIPVVVPPSVAIQDRAERFPVRRIFCVGQNYADHAKEMGSESDRNPPFFFTKPADAVVDTNARLAIPSRTLDFHYEVELVIALGSGGTAVPIESALTLIYGWAVGLDLTRRDLQAAAKQNGRPWDMAKGFDSSAPIAPLVVGAPPAHASLQLYANGELRQKADVASMIWSVAEIIAELSTYVTLAGGDVIFTGTPAGVGPIKQGDVLIGSLQGASSIIVNF
jgi:fumarylpyruvate hydrolase